MHADSVRKLRERPNPAPPKRVFFFTEFGCAITSTGNWQPISNTGTSTGSAKGVDYAIPMKSYNLLLWMVARIFWCLILHVPTYLGKGGSPFFWTDDFADQTVLYQFEIRICMKPCMNSYYTIHIIIV